MAGQQDEVQRAAKTAMVLPGLREAMSRRERLQVSRSEREPRQANDARRRGSTQGNQRLQQSVPAGLSLVATD